MVDIASVTIMFIHKKSEKIEKAWCVIISIIVAFKAFHASAQSIGLIQSDRLLKQGD